MRLSVDAANCACYIINNTKLLWREPERAMKRVIGLLLLLLYLCGCAQAESAATHTDPAEPQTDLAEFAKPVEAAVVPTVAIQTGQVTPTPAATQVESTEPKSAEAVPYQYGYTTCSWRPELAGNYPADEDCDAALLLEKWMNVEGLTLADLDERDCRQLILVVAQPDDGVTTRTVYFTRAEDGSFQAVPELDQSRALLEKTGSCTIGSGTAILPRPDCGPFPQHSATNCRPTV